MYFKKKRKLINMISYVTCFGFPDFRRDFVLNLSSELVYVSIQYFKELCFHRRLVLQLAGY